MKKISTKVIVLSLINSLMIAVLNGVISIIMRNDMQASGSAGTNAPAGAMPILPTPVIIGSVASLFLGAIIAYFFGRYISRPILEVTEITNRTAALDLVYDKSYEQTLKYKDECGAMAAALENTRKVLREMAVKLQKISSALDSHSQRLTSTAEDNVRTITQVVSTIGEIAEGNSSQAQTINEVNATLSELVKLFGNISEDASKGAENAVKSLDTIKEGQKAVDVQVEKMDENISISLETNKSIEDLSSMIEQVASIVNVITSIAEQTNLLALNAAIEAARAGEAGKGFAVVADEIRSLAEGSSKAAKEIIDIIKKTTDKTKLVATNINTANLLVNEQKNALSITQDAFNKIKFSYDHIVNGFQQTADSMKIVKEKSKSISDQTQDMAAVAEESAASTEEISAAGQEQLASIELIAQSSKDLFVLAEELNKEINKFKT